MVSSKKVFLASLLVFAGAGSASISAEEASTTPAKTSINLKESFRKFRHATDFLMPYVGIALYYNFVDTYLEQQFGDHSPNGKAAKKIAETFILASILTESVKEHGGFTKDVLKHGFNRIFGFLNLI